MERYWVGFSCGILHKLIKCVFWGWDCSLVDMHIILIICNIKTCMIEATKKVMVVYGRLAYDFFFLIAKCYLSVSTNSTYSKCDGGKEQRYIFGFASDTRDMSRLK